MANRNLNQLPLNDTPENTDWLLGASGNSPTVFQKIPVGSIIATQSGGGSVNFTQVNTPQTITQSGYYFTDDRTSNLLVTFTNPPLGLYIKWYNDSTKAVVLQGFTFVNGVAIPANQGISIAPGFYLEFHVNNNSGNVKTRSGSYSFNWIPGQEPPGFTWWRVDFNWILTEIQFYYDDNPNTVVTLSGANIVSFTRSATYSTASLDYQNGVINNGSQDGYIGSTTEGFQSYLINIPEFKTVSAINVMCQNGGYNMPTKIRLYSGQSSSQWTLVKEWTGSPINIPNNSIGLKLSVL